MNGWRPKEATPVSDCQSSWMAVASPLYASSWTKRCFCIGCVNLSLTSRGFGVAKNNYLVVHCLSFHWPAWRWLWWYIAADAVAAFVITESKCPWNTTTQSGKQQWSLSLSLGVCVSLRYCMSVRLSAGRCCKFCLIQVDSHDIMVSQRPVRWTVLFCWLATVSPLYLLGAFSLLLFNIIISILITTVIHWEWTYNYVGINPMICAVIHCQCYRHRWWDAWPSQWHRIELVSSSAIFMAVAVIEPS